MNTPSSNNSEVDSDDDNQGAESDQELLLSRPKGQTPKKKTFQKQDSMLDPTTFPENPHKDLTQEDFDRACSFPLAIFNNWNELNTLKSGLLLGTILIKSRPVDILLGDHLEVGGERLKINTLFCIRNNSTTDYGYVIDCAVKEKKVIKFPNAAINYINPIIVKSNGSVLKFTDFGKRNEKVGNAWDNTSFAPFCAETQQCIQDHDSGKKGTNFPSHMSARTKLLWTTDLRSPKKTGKNKTRSKKKGTLALGKTWDQLVLEYSTMNFYDFCKNKGRTGDGGDDDDATSATAGADDDDDDDENTTSTGSTFKKLTPLATASPLKTPPTPTKKRGRPVGTKKDKNDGNDDDSKEPPKKRGRPSLKKSTDQVQVQLQSKYDKLSKDYETTILENTLLKSQLSKVNKLYDIEKDQNAFQKQSSDHLYKNYQECYTLHMQTKYSCDVLKKQYDALVIEKNNLEEQKNSLLFVPFETDI